MSVCPQQLLQEIHGLLRLEQSSNQKLTLQNRSQLFCVCFLLADRFLAAKQAYTNRILSHSLTGARRTLARAAAENTSNENATAENATAENASAENAIGKNVIAENATAENTNTENATAETDSNFAEDATDTRDLAVQADISPAAQHTHADKVVKVQIPKLSDEDVATFETPHRPAQLNVNTKPWLHP